MESGLYPQLRHLKPKLDTYFSLLAVKVFAKPTTNHLAIAQQLRQCQRKMVNTMRPHLLTIRVQYCGG